MGTNRVPSLARIINGEPCCAHCRAHCRLNLVALVVRFCIAQEMSRTKPSIVAVVAAACASGFRTAWATPGSAPLTPTARMIHVARRANQVMEFHLSNSGKQVWCVACHRMIRLYGMVCGREMFPERMNNGCNG